MVEDVELDVDDVLEMVLASNVVVVSRVLLVVVEEVAVLSMLDDVVLAVDDVLDVILASVVVVVACDRASTTTTTANTRRQALPVRVSCIDPRTDRASEHRNGLARRYRKRRR